MSLDKAILHGKEKRKEYRKSAAMARHCRPHGACDRCQGDRLHSNLKRAIVSKEKEKERE